MSEYYMAELYRFFEELSVNNNRPWFEANRQRYEYLRGCWLDDIDTMLADMTLWEPGLATQSAKSCAYRIYRDVRFSRDKSPYKTFFSAAMSPFGRKTSYAAYYIELGLEEHGPGLYGGLWCVESSVLKKLRHAIVDNIEEWQQIVDAPRMLSEFPGWCSSMLKTIPKGWDRSHPQAEYLRMTNYGKVHPTGRAFFENPDWPHHAAALFHTLKPLIDFLNYSIDE